MKHAGTQKLESLTPLLRKLRRQTALVERTPGSFYRRSKAYLHVHEDVQGIFAGIRLSEGKFTRLRVTTFEEQAAPLSRLRKKIFIREHAVRARWPGMTLDMGYISARKLGQA